MTSFSGLFDFVNGTPYTLLVKKSPNRYHLTRLMRTHGMRRFGAVLDKLLADSTPASTTDVTISRVKGVADPSANLLGGVREIETYIPTGANLDGGFADAAPNTQRAVTAADVTEIRDMFRRGASGSTGQGDESANYPTVNGTRTYPPDLSGNGGGGKIGGGI